MYDHYLAKLKGLKGECLFSYWVFEKKRKKLYVHNKGNITSLSKEIVFSFVLLIAGTDCFVPGFGSLFCY